MKYPDFNDIDIKQEKGVSPVSGDTFLMTEYAATLPPQKTLEVGCGTGFTSIYLSKLGFEMTASDMNIAAIILTRQNASINGAELACVESDLFLNIMDSFDLILFNPPYGSTSNSRLTPLLERIKSMIPRNNSLVEKVVYAMISKSRIALIEKFIDGSKAHLNPNGTILLLIHQKESELIKKYSAEIKGQWKHMLLVSITPHK